MNTQEKHTLGPWWIDDDGFVASGSGETYKTIADPHCMPPEGNEAEMVANARLIAAAPELLAALEAFNDAYEAKWKWGDLDVWLDFMAKANEQAKLAIAKARGERH